MTSQTPETPIDRDLVHSEIRKYPAHYYRHLLDRAIDIMSEAQIAQLLKGYVNVDKLRQNGTQVESLKWTQSFGQKMPWYVLSPRLVAEGQSLWNWSNANRKEVQERSCTKG